MAIRSVELKDFTAFEDARFELSPALNVLIGTNGTGKTHLMKVAYATLRAIDARRSPLDLRNRLQAQLAGVFLPEDDKIARLVRRGRGQRSATVQVASSAGSLSFSIYSKDSSIRVKKLPRHDPPRSLFLPSRELLAIYPGFIAAYQERELAFDATYFDAMVALGASAKRGSRGERLDAVLTEIRRMVGGRVVLKGDRFYVRGRHGNIEAPLVAEGHRKLGALAHLISNGSVAEQAILLWDEPEANLNPMLVRATADILASLSRAGLQIVLATHDYLMLRTLARHGRGGVPIRFFSLEDGGVTFADDLDELAVDPIRRAFMDHYDAERAGSSGDTAGRRSASRSGSRSGSRSVSVSRSRSRR